MDVAQLIKGVGREVQTKCPQLSLVSDKSLDNHDINVDTCDHIDGVFDDGDAADVALLDWRGAHLE